MASHIVILFVSDVHIGRGPRATERRKEAALIDCLEAHYGEAEHLYLLGDIFDGYIEYDHLVPKEAVRFRALLAQWTDDDIPVTYLTGNHDSWHNNYFCEELGVHLVRNPLRVEHDGIQLCLRHGDGKASRHGLYRWIRPVLRHPKSAWLYRSLLPADLGVGLARWISRRLHEDGPDPDVVDALRAHAQRYLRTNGTHAIVMGHSHVPSLHAWSAGVYLNTGNWYEERTFGRLDGDGMHLARWNGTRALDIEAADVG